MILSSFLYLSGFFAQFWKNRTEGFILPSFWPHKCAGALLSPFGFLGVLITLFLCMAGVLIYWLRKQRFSDLEYDSERNFYYSKTGSYGTAGWMRDQDIAYVFDRTPLSEIDRVRGDILGMVNGDVISLPEDTRFNGHTAVFGSSGSMKSRAYVRNKIITTALRGHSIVLTDSKGELYRDTSEYLREKGYTTRILNLVNPALSHKWNFLQEIIDAGEEREDLMTQMVTETIIRNTAGERSDHFWDSAEQNLLKALILYQLRQYKSKGSANEPFTMEKVIALLSDKRSIAQLGTLFGKLEDGDPAMQPWSIFLKASETVQGNVIVGLGSRLQVFHNKLICQMTNEAEIDLELPGKEKCAYFVIMSDQDRSLDFLSALFFSIFFIKLTRFADTQTCDGRCPVPVHFVLDEILNIGKIPLGSSLSSVRSRGITISPIFQAISQLENRYPHNEYMEILGNCDLQLCMGVAEEYTAKIVSNRTGIVTIGVNSVGRQRNIWSLTDYVPDYRENRSVGKRPLLTPDEVQRLPANKLLIMARSHQVLMAEKFDFTEHPESAKFKPVPLSVTVPGTEPTARTPPPNPDPRPISRVRQRPMENTVLQDDGRAYQAVTISHKKTVYEPAKEKPGL